MQIQQCMAHTDMLVTEKRTRQAKRGCHRAAPLDTVRYFMNNNSHVLGSFLDVSKAFDKVLHNGLFKKLLDRNVPACLVLLLKYWDGHLQCAVRWCNVLDNWFPILSGVHQGGVLSPVLFSIYIDDHTLAR